MILTCSIGFPILMLVSQIFELASHCPITNTPGEYECLLEQSVLAASSASEDWIIFLT